jgi:tRNA(Arg) A34 adenosine deaminase TadA
VRAACTAGRTRSLAGSTLYTTVEPCIFCGFAARSVGIARLVYGAPAGQLGACYPPYALMTDTTIEAWGTPPSIVQMLTPECTALLERYAAQRRSSLPTG